MQRVVISEFMDQGAVDKLASRFDTLYDPALVDRPDGLAAALAGAAALVVRNRTQVRGDLLSAGDALRVVGRLGVGLDNIDLEACKARGIVVIPATGANDDSVAEYVITGALMLRRGAFLATAEVAGGGWPRNRLMGREVMGATLGLVGFGSNARSTARRAVALGMHVIAYDPFVVDSDPAWSAIGAAPRALDALLAEADIVSLHVPLLEATRNVIDAAALARMKPDAVLINAARGGIVDEAALAEGLKAGGLAGAMLDVFDREPLPGGGPLEGVPNLILTPHIAGVTQESNLRVSHLIADKLIESLGGEQ